MSTVKFPRETVKIHLLLIHKPTSTHLQLKSFFTQFLRKSKEARTKTAKDFCKFVYIHIVTFLSQTFKLTIIRRDEYCGKDKFSKIQTKQIQMIQSSALTQRYVMKFTSQNSRKIIKKSLY